MVAEPSRRLFGGHTAVQRLPRTSIAFGVGPFARLRNGRVALGAGLAASAVLALTAAAALPSTVPPSRARAATAPAPQPQYLGVAAEAPVVKASAESDPNIRRFTGQVGPDLSRSLEAAGVPEVQGRE